jgi:DNA-binding CsgD family transcriptional regulator
MATTPKTLSDQLSKTEKTVLRHIADGKTSKQIADELNVSRHTIDTHRRNMIGKTNAANTAALIILALKERLFE